MSKFRFCACVLCAALTGCVDYYGLQEQQRQNDERYAAAQRQRAEREASDRQDGGGQIQRCSLDALIMDPAVFTGHTVEVRAVVVSVEPETPIKHQGMLGYALCVRPLGEFGDSAVLFIDGSDWQAGEPVFLGLKGKHVTLVVQVSGPALGPAQPAIGRVLKVTP